MAISGKPVRHLSLVGSTRHARQWENERGIVTAMDTAHSMRQLAGRTLVTLRPLTVFVVDPKWAEVLGPVLLVPGGTALEVDDGFLAEYARRAEDRAAGLNRPGVLQHVPVVPCRVVDPDLPPVRVVVDPHDVEENCNVSAPGSGSRVGKPSTKCGHPARTVEDLVGRSCPGCFMRWWKAREMTPPASDREAVRP